VVIQARAAQLAVVHVEAQRPHQVQPCAGVGAQADRVAGVGRDFRLMKNDVEQWLFRRVAPGNNCRR
jgi:hypothetical protein